MEESILSFSMLLQNKWLAEHGIDRQARRTVDPKSRLGPPYGESNMRLPCPTKWEYPRMRRGDWRFTPSRVSRRSTSNLPKNSSPDAAGVLPASDWTNSRTSGTSATSTTVDALATIFYNAEQLLDGKGDIEFLKRSISKLMLTFSCGNWKTALATTSEGGFLGLQNIGVFLIEFAGCLMWMTPEVDGTAWGLAVRLTCWRWQWELTAQDPREMRHGREVCGALHVDRGSGHERNGNRRERGMKEDG